jgi:hypothetical protein
MVCLRISPREAVRAFLQQQTEFEGAAGPIRFEFSSARCVGFHDADMERWPVLLVF